MAKKKTDKLPPGAEFLVCRNPKARHDYELSETLEAGLMLQGSEVKSLRMRRASLEGAYASIDRDEAWLHGAHIAPYEQAGPHFGHEPKRKRKLLLHRREIERLRGALSRRGFTLVALSIYFKNGRAKVELGLGRGLNKGDQRQNLREQADKRETRDAMRRAKY